MTAEAYAEYILSKDPSHYYKLDETAGTTFVDSGPAGLDATLTVGTLRTTANPVGVFTSAIDFQNDTIITADLAARWELVRMNAPLEWTVNWWVSTHTLNNNEAFNSMIGNSIGSAESGWSFIFDNRVASGSNTLGMYQDGSSLSSGFVDDVFIDTNMHMVTVTASLTTIEVFRDGVSIGTMTNNYKSSTPVDATSFGGIEHSGTNYYYDGELCQISFHRTKWTQAEIDLAYTLGMGTGNTISGTASIVTEVVSTAQAGWDMEGTEDQYVGTWDLKGTATLSSTTPKFGSQCLDCTGNGSHASTSVSLLDAPTTAMTIEVFYWPTNSAEQYGRVFQFTDGDFISALSISHDLSNQTQLRLDSSNNGSSWQASAQGTLKALVLNAWNHVAAVWDNGEWRLYIEGDRALTVAMTGPPYWAAGNTMCIGGQTSGSRDTHGRFDGFKISQEVLYTGDTYTVPTSPPQRYVNTPAEGNVVRAVDALTGTSVGEAVVDANGAYTISLIGNGPAYVYEFGDYGAEWEALTAYALDDVVHPSTPNGYKYVCTVAGTSAASEPTWPTSGTVVDSGVTWSAVAHRRPRIHGPIEAA